MASSRGKPLKTSDSVGIVEMPFDFAARLAAQFAHQGVQGAQDVEEVARLRHFVGHRLDDRLAAILDRRQRVGDDEDAERRAADDEELERLKQHLEMAAERAVAAEDAADGDDQSDDEIQRPLSSLDPPTVRRKLTPGCHGEVSLMQGREANLPGGVEPRRGVRPLRVFRDAERSLRCACRPRFRCERRLETIASNVANMNTVGYRADGVTFETEVAKAGDNRIAYVSTGSPFISRQTGATVKTGNPFDVAVQGDGWMSISNANGVAYTRDGRMRMSETGALETLNGDAVLDAGGAPIILNPAADAPTISGDGMIAQDGRQVGAIGLFAIDDDAKLTRTGTSGVIPDKPPTPILDFTQKRHPQGFVEGANVNPIQEMTKLIAVTRTFDGVSSQMSQTEASLQDAIKTLGTVG